MRVTRKRGASSSTTTTRCREGVAVESAIWGITAALQTVVLKYGAGVNSTVGGVGGSAGALRGLEACIRHGRLTLGRDARAGREGWRARGSVGAMQDERDVDPGRRRVCGSPRRRGRTYKDGRVYLEGERSAFPELAGTLEAIGEGGAEVMYEGELGRRLSGYIPQYGWDHARGTSPIPGCHSQAPHRRLRAW